jgi:hypothetical protein
VPDFTDALTHHRTLEAIERAAEGGVRVMAPYEPSKEPHEPA